MCARTHTNEATARTSAAGTDELGVCLSQLPGASRYANTPRSRRRDRRLLRGRLVCGRRASRRGLERASPRCRSPRRARPLRRLEIARSAATRCLRRTNCSAPAIAGKTSPVSAGSSPAPKQRIVGHAVVGNCPCHRRNRIWAHWPARHHPADRPHSPARLILGPAAAAVHTDCAVSPALHRRTLLGRRAPSHPRHGS